jgi:hypothetical protein
MVLDAMEVWAASLRDSDYEGWVAYVDGSPIFEAAPFEPRLAQPVIGAHVHPYRPAGRNVIEWRDLPHERVHRVELYFCRQRYQQPVIRMDRQPGNVQLRFIQLKLGGLVLESGVGRDITGGGPRRLGIRGYRIGYWNPATNECELFEITPRERLHLGKRRHPCELPPRGFGLAPHVVGLPGGGPC